MSVKGMRNPTLGQQFAEVPFTSLKKPLSESQVALLSTSGIAIHHDPETEENLIKEKGFRGVHTMVTDHSNGKTLQSHRKLR